MSCWELGLQRICGIILSIIGGKNSEPNWGIIGQLDGIKTDVRSSPDTLPCTYKMAETPNCPESRESESSIEQPSAASGSSTDSSSSKSLLDVLKAPTLAEIARKRAVRVNLPPSGKRRCRGGRITLLTCHSGQRLLERFCSCNPLRQQQKEFFSLLMATFTEQQEDCLQDYIEASIMLQFNKH